MGALKVGIAMSGGVDSTVAAILLREQGFQVHGFFMVLPLPHQEHQERRVREVAGRLALPLSLVDLRMHFADTVIRAFVDSYRRGLTPNPCILCNQAIKFGLLADHMRHCGMDRIATGHYARIRMMDGQPFLARAADQGKDQSYFLARLSADQIARCHFPLGEWTKEQAYRKASSLGLSFAGEESQDVCFLAAGLPEFLAGQGLDEQAGPVVDRHGRKLGEHRGCWRYTIGQRRGLGLPDASPWYVIALDGPANRVVVGKNEDLLRDGCAIQDLQWMGAPPALPWRGLVQLRSRHRPCAAVVDAEGPDGGRIVFDLPQRAITPGQFAVFYQDDRVVGSAVIGQTPSSPSEARA